MNAIETQGLTRKFWGKKAVDGLDLEVPEGSIYAYLGPNGAGKTTTLKMLMNLLRPSSGEARVLGVRSTDLDARAFEKIGYVSEDQELPGWMTVRRFLAYLKPFYPTWDDALCRQLLDKLELPMNRKLKHLSRGMKMKAKLVSSLVYRPKLLVLDEPFSGLDPLVRDQLVEGILELGGEEKWTILVSSHDVAEVESLCSHVGFLAHGQLELSEDLESLHDRFREVQVVFEEAPSVLPELPVGWIHPRLENRVLRFVDTGFDATRTEEALRQRVPGIFDSTATPMTLREIFLALAVAARDGEAGSGREKVSGRETDPGQRVA